VERIGLSRCHWSLASGAFKQRLEPTTRTHVTHSGDPYPATHDVVVYFQSRSLPVTGKYANYELMRECLPPAAVSHHGGVRRNASSTKMGQYPDYLDLKRYTHFAQHAGCFSAEDAVRHARLARETSLPIWQSRRGLGEARMPGRPENLLPILWPPCNHRTNWSRGITDVSSTLSDEIRSWHRRLKEAGAAQHHACRQPDRSGQGFSNPNNIRIVPRISRSDRIIRLIVDAGTWARRAMYRGHGAGV